MEAPNRSYLPPDLVEEILDLLPFKSIDRLRSVSKSLFSLLAIKFNVRPKLLHKPCIILKYGMKPSDDQDLFTGVVLSDYSVGKVKNQGYMAPELFSARPDQSYFFLGSCNGLVCLDVTNHCGKKETFVWNPFTGICRKLPHTKFPHRSYSYAYGFGYDSASNDYKVFAATSPLDPRPGDYKVEIFSLKIGSWKELNNPDVEHLQHMLRNGDMGLFFNGALHWPRPREESPWEGQKGEIIAAIAFDLEKEKFYHVLSPPIQISPGFRSASVGVVVGEYLCFSHRDCYKNIIWVMKEYCNEASWVPFISYSFTGTTFPDLGVGNEGEGRVEYVCDFIPRSFTEYGRYMILQFSRDLHVLRWNNSLEEGDYKAWQYAKSIKFGIVMGNGALPYTQTLTSPYVS
ncbi:hypothetical protein Tsubulata_015719 [Turnera subulata]|uniref:F-box domain-containing protein n=1 Tax=Turnera subulata TaxID=218843 RepID=A0A9Q0G377_9ROSI|nr:hypothetical protein Tsubulata_015719 [Turnera subulata]